MAKLLQISMEHLWLASINLLDSWVVNLGSLSSVELLELNLAHSWGSNYSTSYLYHNSFGTFLVIFTAIIRIDPTFHQHVALRNVDDATHQRNYDNLSSSPQDLGWIRLIKMDQICELSCQWPEKRLDPSRRFVRFRTTDKSIFFLPSSWLGDQT